MKYYDFTVIYEDLTGKTRTVTVEATTKSNAKKIVMTGNLLKRIVSIK